MSMAGIGLQWRSITQSFVVLSFHILTTLFLEGSAPCNWGLWGGGGGGEGRVVRRCSVTFQGRDVLLIWIIVGQFGWLVGWFGFNGPLRQYFSLYRAVSQREGERGERIDESKNVQNTQPAPTASAIRPCPCPIVIKIVGRPGTGSLPSTIAPPDHPL